MTEEQQRVKKQTNNKKKTSDRHRANSYLETFEPSNSEASDTQGNSASCNIFS